MKRIAKFHKVSPEQFAKDWKDKLQEIIPTYGQSLAENLELTKRIRNYTKEKLNLDY